MDFYGFKIHYVSLLVIYNYTLRISQILFLIFLIQEKQADVKTWTFLFMSCQHCVCHRYILHFGSKRKFISSYCVLHTAYRVYTVNICLTWLDSDKGQIVMSRRLGHKISETARLSGCFGSAVLSTENGPMRGKLRSINDQGENRPSYLVWTNRTQLWQTSQKI